MTLIGHLRELRNRILFSLAFYVVCAMLSFVFSKQIIGLFTSQFTDVSSAIESNLVVTTIIEGFVAQIKIALMSGLIFSMPVIVFNVMGFVFPGLSRKQRTVIIGCIGASTVLILAGSYMAYFHIIPLAIQFLTNPHFIPQGVGFLLNYQANIFYVFSFILWSLAALQLPLILEVLMMMNVLKRKDVFKASRFIIIGIFILAAIITPPDFISQLGIALPLILMFFLVLLVAKTFKFGES